MAYFRCTGNSGGSLKLRTAQGEIASFETNLPEPYQSVTVNVVATGGYDADTQTAHPIVGYSSANIVNTQNESIVDLFSIDSDFRGTVAFNQINAPANNRTRTAGGVDFTNNNDGSVSVNGTCSGTNNYGISYNVATISGHKLLVCGCVSTSNYWINSNGGESSPVGSNGVIVTSDGNTQINLHMENGAVINTKVYPQIFDLTAMFGSTIADYIYSLEQATAGAGVAFFRNIYPEDYYAYDSGTTEIVGKETPEATIAFGQTVYGGVLDVTRGKLHVTYGGVSATSSDTAAGQVHTSNNGWAFTLSNKDAIYKPQGNATSNINVVTTYSAATTSGFVTVISTSKPLFFLADSDTGLDGTATLSQIQSAFETFCNNYNPFAIYELATPFDIDLTPVQIEALIGENNVYSNTGDTEVKYLKKDS